MLPSDTATPAVLTAEQAEAAELAIKHISTKSAPFFVGGYAGSGKTTTLASVAKMLNCIVAAPTGKACSVIRKKIGREAQTLHSLFYDCEEIKDTKRNFIRLDWHKKQDLSFEVPILIDEASMVQAWILRDLLDAGARIIAFGDPGQLPPVNAEPAFKTPDYVLETIHRQALESSIIRQAHRVRHGDLYHNDGDDFVVCSQLNDYDLFDADVILCHLNDTRRRVNDYMRTLNYTSGHWPCSGEPLVCLRNDPKTGLMNGEVVTVASDFVEGGPLFLEGGIVVKKPYIEGLDLDLKTSPKLWPGCFAFGYALTVHKSQGSEWPRVLIIDEYKAPLNWSKWTYTAITRASQSVKVMRHV